MATGGVQRELNDTFAEIVEHWSGEAAEAFRRRAAGIVDLIGRTASYVRRAEYAVRGAQQSLQSYQRAMLDVGTPAADGQHGDAGRAAGGPAEDEAAAAALRSGVPAERVLEEYRGRLSAPLEEKLQRAVVMEYLGAALASNGKMLDQLAVAPVAPGIPLPPCAEAGGPLPVVPLPEVVFRRRLPPVPRTPSAQAPAARGPGITPAVSVPRLRGIEGGVPSAPGQAGDRGSQGGSGLHVSRGGRAGGPSTP